MLETHNITVRYGALKALDDVSLTLEAGEILGVVGPNGAGKTTLFKVATGLLAPQAGAVSFDGQPIGSLPSSTIGYLADTPFQFEFFTVEELLMFERALKLPELAAERVYELISLLDLDGVKTTTLRSLSQGLRKRVAVASAFLCRPTLLVLDEPLNTLDIQTVIVLKSLICDAQSQGAHILISSHVLDFFDGLLTKVLFLDHGKPHLATLDDTHTAEAHYRSFFMED